MALNFKRILCPVDLSRFSRDALKLAAEISKSANATLYLLHVIHNPLDELYMTSITQADPASIELYRKEPSKRSQLLKTTKEHSQILLKQYYHNQLQQIPKARYIIETGDPFEKIIDVAEGRRINLIVLATHGRTGIKRLIIGNVAEKVVRHAPCAVLTVRAKTRKRR